MPIAEYFVRQNERKRRECINKGIRIFIRMKDWIYALDSIRSKILRKD